MESEYAATHNASQGDPVSPTRNAAASEKGLEKMNVMPSLSSMVAHSPSPIKLIKNPSGAAIFLKTAKVKDNVKTIYLEYPSTRGDDRLLIKRYLDRFCPQVRLTAKQFELLRTIPSFETIRRRGQELRAEIPSLQPTERVKQKRYRRSEAFRHYYGDGQLHVSDFTKEAEKED
jgi:hypothetical protein